MITFKDFFKVPFSKPRKLPYQTLWVLLVIITAVPGTLLFILSLGSFRYFHLMSLVVDYLVNQDIKNNGYYF